MKLIKSNGLKLEVRNISDVLMQLEAAPFSLYPLPLYDEIVSDEEARQIIRELLDTKRYLRAK